MTGLVLATGIATLAFSAAAASASPCEKQDQVDLRISGRIVSVQASPLPPPQDPDVIDMTSLWTYQVQVHRVLSGKEKRRRIVVQGLSHASMRHDRIFIFDLCRTDEKTYWIVRDQ